jgi:DNA-binding CsgD family transcriptional regulator
MAISAEKLASLIGDTYVAGNDQTAWPTVLESIRDAFGGSKACVARIGPDLTPTDAISTPTDPSYNQTFISEYASDPDSVYRPLAALPVGTVYHDHTLFGSNTLRKTRLWNEWMVPQGMYDGLACKLGQRGSSCWLLDIQRTAGRPDYDKDDMQLLSIIAPHVRRAASLSRSVAAQRTTIATFDHLSVAAFILDDRFLVRSMNQAADALICRHKPNIEVRSGVLSIASANAASRMEQLIKRDCGPGSLPTDCVGGGMMIRFDTSMSDVGDLAISVKPFAEAGMFPTTEPLWLALFQELSIELGDSFSKKIRDIFSLTTKEAKLATSLTEGHSLKTAATAQNIAFSTARSYLEPIFRKTGCHQQSQLVALLKTFQALDHK